jgi:uncharacterized membrane protein
MMIEVLQDFQFDSCLVLKFLFVANDFDGYKFFGFVVHALDSLSKATLTEKFENLISVAKMIFQYHLIVSLVIIVAMIENIHLFKSLLLPLNLLWTFFTYQMTFDFSFAILTYIINFIVKIKNFLFFIVV